MPIKVVQSVQSLNPTSTTISPENIQILQSKGYLTSRQALGIVEKSIDNDEIREIFENNKDSAEFLALAGQFITVLELERFKNAYNASARRYDIPFPSADEPQRKSPDAQSCFFELSEIKDFLEKNRLDLENPQGLGIRIYFGVHAYNDSKHPLFLTTILVPTKFNGMTRPSGKPVQEDNLNYVTIGGGPYNHGTLCPPDDTCP